MAKPVKNKALGRKLLLSVAIGATPIVGIPVATAQEQLIQTQVQSDVDAQQRALFDQAAQSGNAARINSFIRTYPDSPLVRALLANLPPETLRLVDPEALTYVSPTIIRSLPPATRQSLGLGGQTNDVGGSGNPLAAEDPYL